MFPEVGSSRVCFDCFPLQLRLCILRQYFRNLHLERSFNFLPLFYHFWFFRIQISIPFHFNHLMLTYFMRTKNAIKIILHPFKSLTRTSANSTLSILNSFYFICKLRFTACCHLLFYYCC